VPVSNAIWRAPVGVTVSRERLTVAAESSPLWPTLIGGAIGFISAIFAEPLRRWLYRAKLELTFGAGSEYKARTPEQATLIDPQRSAVPIYSTHEAEYVRIKVINTSSFVAKGCRAYLVGVQKKNANGEFAPTIYCDSISLAWSCQEDRAHGPLDLPKDVPQFIDLVTVRDHSSEFRIEIKPVPLRYAGFFRDKGTFRFTVQVSGENVKPEFISVDFTWNGAWDKYEATIGERHG